MVWVEVVVFSLVFVFFRCCLIVFLVMFRWNVIFFRCKLFLIMFRVFSLVIVMLCGVVMLVWVFDRIFSVFFSLWFENLWFCCVMVRMDCWLLLFRLFIDVIYLKFKLWFLVNFNILLLFDVLIFDYWVILELV